MTNVTPSAGIGDAQIGDLLTTGDSKPDSSCPNTRQQVVQVGRGTRPSRNKKARTKRASVRQRNQGVTLLTRVDQLLSALRVPPHVPGGATRYWAYVQVWATYSDAIQIELPSSAAAP